MKHFSFYSRFVNLQNLPHVAHFSVDGGAMKTLINSKKWQATSQGTRRQQLPGSENND